MESDKYQTAIINSKNDIVMSKKIINGFLLLLAVLFGLMYMGILQIYVAAVVIFWVVMLVYIFKIG